MALYRPSSWRIVLEGSPDVTILDLTDQVEREPGPLTASYRHQEAPKFRASDVTLINRGHTRRRLTVSRVSTYSTVQAARNALWSVEADVSAWTTSTAATVTVFTYSVSGTLSETYTLDRAKVIDFSGRITGAKRVAFDFTIEFGDVTNL